MQAGARALLFYGLIKLSGSFLHSCHQRLFGILGDFAEECACVSLDENLAGAA